MSQRTAHGQAIRAIREAVGVSISAFAPRCGVSQGYLSRVELGDATPSPTVLRAIADQLGVGLDAVSYVVPMCTRCENVG
jgi:transcriptional regulator with XRE-family HTH domain